MSCLLVPNGQAPGDVRAKTKRQLSAYSKATRAARSGTISPRAGPLTLALSPIGGENRVGFRGGEYRERVVRTETGDDRARCAHGAGLDRDSRPWPRRAAPRRVPGL